MTDTYVWKGPCLLTPVTVEALLIGDPNRTSTWASLQMAYQNLAFDVDPSPPPFAKLSGSDTPGTGAHMMTILPNGLRHAVNDGSGSGFQPIPNRWLIVRFLNTTDGQPPQIRAWVLQSDYTGPDATNPWPDAAPNNFIGKAYDIVSWTEPGGPAMPVLRATAPGSISWAGCYSNIRNIMGFYDPLQGVTNGLVSYGMLGWYQPARFDPLLGVTASDPEGFTDEATWQALMRTISCVIPGGAAGLTSAQDAWAEWLARHPLIKPGVETLPPAQQSFAGQIVCHGFVYGLAWQGKAISYPRAPILSSTNPIDIAVGSTGIEAIAAWMAKVLGNPKAESLLLALGENLVFNYASDRSDFEQETLTRRFAKTVGETVWQVALKQGEQPANSDVQQSIPLTPQQTTALTRLNAAEAAIDDASRSYETVLWELFALVWKNNRDLTSDTPYQALIEARVAILKELQATEAEQTVIRDETLARLRDLLPTETYTLSSAPAPRFMSGLAPTVLIAGAAPSTPYQNQTPDGDLPCRFTGQTLTGLEVPAVFGLTTQTEITAIDLLGLVTLPDNPSIPKEYPDFVGEWMLLDTGNARWIALLAYKKAGVTTYTKADLDGLTRTIKTLQTIPTNSGLTGPLTPETLGEAAGFIGVMPPAFSALPYAPAWVPLYIDWQTSWAPSASRASAMLADWKLEGYSYEWTGTAIGDITDTYQGRTMLNTAVAAQFASTLTDFVHSEQMTSLLPFQQQLLRTAAAAISTYDIITQAMAGLDSNFITRQGSVTRLAYQSGNDDLDKIVNTYLAEANSIAPMPGTTANPPGFYPLRAGHMKIDQLWAVDGFGQVLIPSSTGTVLPIRAEGVWTKPTGTSENLAYLQLKPQIASPMRLELVRLDADDDSIPTNSSDSTTSIAGWLLPNHLDDSLQVFATNGAPLGEILPVVNDLGSGLIWEPAPGLATPLGAPPEIPNPHVAAFVNGLLRTQLTSGARALTDLLNVIDTSLWATAPISQPVNIATAALVGCPLAIVRGSIALQSSGNLPYDQAWADTEINDDGGLSNVPIPTYVGDLSLNSNGVLGFFLNDDYTSFRPARNYDPPNGSTRVAALRKGFREGRNLRASLTSAPTSDIASGYVAPDPSFPLQPDGPADLLTIVMDPRGWITALNGLVPVVSTALQPGAVAQVMANLGATFRIGPVLWDEQSPDLPLPGIGSAQWSWIARTAVSVWETQSNLPTTQPKTVVAPRTLALREGWLSLSDFVEPPSKGDSKTLRRIRPRVSSAGVPHVNNLSANKNSLRGKQMTTVYTYDLRPTDLECGATANMPLIISNAGTAQTGNLQNIIISVPTGDDTGSLTDAPGSVNLTASEDTTRAGWAGTFMNDVSGWVIRLQGPPLKALQVLSFSLNNVRVNANPGPVSLPIKERFGSPQGTGLISLLKQFSQLAIDKFDPEPAITSVPGQTDLVWTVRGGSKVLLLPMTVEIPTEGSGPWSSSYPVSITTGPDTAFTLQLWKDDHQYISKNTIAYAGPVKASLNNSALGAIDTTTPVTFQWMSSYATPPLYLFPTPGGTMRIGTQGSVTFTPGTLLSDNSSSLTVTLQANGWTGPASATTTVFFNPVEILYLRYTDSAKTNAIFGVKNNNPRQTSLVLDGGIYTLTANGPGGPITQQLGDVPALQVQYFTATPSSPAIGDSVKLSYQTANATGLTINGGAVAWDSATQIGSTTITYGGPQILEMVATGAGGTTLSSQLSLPYTS